jgi:methyltransferase
MHVRPGRGDRLYLALLAAVGAQRLAELAISRRNERRAGSARGTAGERSYPAMVALHVALFALPLAERRLLRRRALPALAVAALAGEAAATGLRLWVIAALGPNWNVRGRVHDGLRVVDDGPYRWLRHPNYTAVALEMAALPLAGGATLSAVLLSAGNALVLLPRVRGEEALLAQVPGYAEVMGHKPRFLPRPAILRRPLAPRGSLDAVIVGEAQR